MALNIVILGGSFGGVVSAHYILQKVLPSFPPDSYHVYVVDFAEKLYNSVPAPRSIANSQLMPYEKFFLNYDQVFSRYPKTQVSFVHARATGVDLENRTVSLQRIGSSGDDEDLPYHALIIATGNTFESPLWYIENSATETQQLMAQYESALRRAKTVLIGGGGPVGVELAGEVGEQLNGAPGWLRSAPTPSTQVTVYSGGTRLLPTARPAIGAQAERQLARVGVRVVHGVRVASAAPTADGRTAVALSDGTTATVDVYVAATGTRPATDWAPAVLLDGAGRVATNARTLRVEAPGAGPRVYAVGDVGSHTRGGVLNIYNAAPVLGENLRRDLLAADAKMPVPGVDREFANAPLETLIVPVGRGKGVGAFSGWRLPSFLVWLIKGRDYVSGMSRGRLMGD